MATKKKRKSVRYGDIGADVEVCQERLTKHGYTCEPNGNFGTATQALVMQFQASNDLDKDGEVGPNTWEALLARPKKHQKIPPQPLPLILRLFEPLGYEVVWEGDFHLNLFGIRNQERKSNNFDDVLGCAYTENGMWKVHYWPGTTDPGLVYLKDPGKAGKNKSGKPIEATAILKEGQYPDAWQIGTHQNKYEALCQKRKVTVYRDSNKDDVLDVKPSVKTEKGEFGINIHRSKMFGKANKVNNWSAGCQVHATSVGFEEMMSLARKQVDKLGIRDFTYTLLLDEWL